MSAPAQPAAPLPGLAGRVAIVTGASRGIGRAAALRLAAAGARVLATARDEGRLAALAAEAPACVPFAADLARDGAAEAVVAAAARLGPPAVLVAAHGVPGFTDRPVWEMEPAAWRESLAVNLDAPFLLTRAVAPLMRAAGRGRIVYVASTAGQVGAPAMAAYCAGKHGLIGLMRAAAQDLGRFGGAANAVCPGWVRTDMAEDDARAEAARRGVAVAEIWAERDRSYPRGRVLSPEEVAETIAFLCSDAAAGINGEAVTVALGGLW